ncbi:GNAT family N-acetyltransferase, partial [Mycobacterium sp.]|uniref:GNAT family N-acetyltransferase n=1 Tax=Mycobacterium sp. TaxID=1785 RepID=UPI002DA4C778|nr:GNAT family N-acetyltransferase [Mycobacterium sp.]
MDGVSMRRATAADLAAIQRLIADAYAKYIVRIGRPPAPMTADYAAALQNSRVWVLQERDALVGAMVTEDHRDHVLLETVAVDTRSQGRGFGRLL